VTWWWLVHPFVRFWRGLGPVITFFTLTLYSFALIAVLYLLRGPILSIEFGTNHLLWPLAILCYGLSVYIEVRARKHLRVRVLLGVPELAEEGKRGTLLTEGIYGRIRHPRYVAVTLGTFAVAFFTNYLAVYVIAILIVPALYLVVVLEERELHDRFGPDWERYARRVPRFFPSFGRPSSDKRVANSAPP
jgi:protein-S-isoprenylcysteine O-methyltransferase Ste14